MLVAMRAHTWDSRLCMRSDWIGLAIDDILFTTTEEPMQSMLLEKMFMDRYNMLNRYLFQNLIKQINSAALT
jgi:hypothetical protein